MPWDVAWLAGVQDRACKTQESHAQRDHSAQYCMKCVEQDITSEYSACGTNGVKTPADIFMHG